MVPPVDGTMPFGSERFLAFCYCLFPGKRLFAEGTGLITYNLPIISTTTTTTTTTTTIIMGADARGGKGSGGFGRSITCSC